MCLQKELAQNPNCPHMCAYKLVTVEFKWMGLQNKMESYIQKVQNTVVIFTCSRENRIFNVWKFVFCLSVYIFACCMLTLSIILTHFPGGEALVYPLPQTTVLLNRPMDQSDDGGHTTNGRRDTEGTG